MADSVERLRRDLLELREDVLELVAQGSLAAEPGIPLEAFARLVGRSADTLRKDLRSKDLTRRRRWPVFYRPADGGDEHTTAADVRRWREERCKTTSPVPRALAARLVAGGRT